MRYVQKRTAAVHTVGDLGDSLGTAEDGGWVRALLRVGFGIGPNLAGIGSVQWLYINMISDQIKKVCLKIITHACMHPTPR
jgi:hypothetical protein